MNDHAFGFIKEQSDFLTPDGGARKAIDRIADGRSGARPTEVRTEMQA